MLDCLTDLFNELKNGYTPLSDDLPTYGDWSRVDVRRHHDGLDAIAVYVHDKAEIDTPGFRKFIKQAVSAYLKSQGIEKKGAKKKGSRVARSGEA